MTAPPSAPVSVLMATYCRENPEHLRRALESIYEQTIPADQCVLVLDGPVGEAIETVIASFRAREHAMQLDLVRLGAGGGLARALNAGLPLCRNAYVMRMDSDDVAVPTRVARQWQESEAQPDADLICSWQYEFEDDEEKPFCVRRTPRDHDAIRNLLKWRCCLSHPTILVRKSMYEKIGGYRTDVGFLEDYDLYVRLMVAGARFTTIEEPLLKFRTGQAQRARRSGWSYARKEWIFRNECRKYGFLSRGEFLKTAGAQVGFRLIPPAIKAPLYRLVRKPVTP